MHFAYSSILIRWHRGMACGTCQNCIPFNLRSPVKKAIRAINNLAYHEHTNTYFKCDLILKLSDQYKLQVSNYIFQMLYFNIDEEIELNLHFNNQIHYLNTRSNDQLGILRVNRSNTKHCGLHNGMITWNSSPNVFKSTYPFRCSR